MEEKMIEKVGEEMVTKFDWTKLGKTCAGVGGILIGAGLIYKGVKWFKNRKVDGESEETTVDGSYEEV